MFRLMWLLLAGMAALFAQVDTGAISGIVRDASSAVIAGTRVQIINEATNIQLNLVTNSSGFYSAQALKPGQYSVTVSRDGFTTEKRAHLELHVQERLEVNFDLKINASNTEVTVLADSPLLESESSSVGNVVQSKTIQELPLNGRNFSQLAVLSAGTLPSVRSAERDSFVANGARPVQNSYLLDGIDNRNRIVGFDSSTAQSIQPVLDGIQEFKVQTNNYSAEFGQAAGGVVNVTMRSGTNDLHGSLFEFHRNSAVSATPYFQAVKGLKPQFLQNQFGATLGGPVIRNRTFFFASWQSDREISAAPQVGTVPLPSLQSGNFGSRAIYDPATVRPNPNGTGYVRSPFPNNIIPTNRFDPVAAKLAALYPAPNLPGSANNLVTNPSQRVSGDQGNIRVDHQIGSRDSVFGRFSIFDGRNALPPTLPEPANNRMVASPTAQSIAASHTHTFSSSVFNEFRFGFMHTREQQQALADRLFEAYGIQGTYQDPTVKGLPTFGITGLSTLGTTGPGSLNIAATGSGNLPIDKWGRVFQFIDNLNWVTGRHSLKFGVDITQSTLHGFVTLQARPSINFSGVYTQDPQNRSATGSPYADFLLGLSNNTTISNRPNNDSRQRIYQGYVLDDWKLSSRLTLNLGLRYELAKPFIEVNNRQSNFILESGPYFGQLILAADAGKIGRSAALVDTDWNNFAPRIGLAYKATSSTVLRSAFGVFYGRDENLGISARITNNPPFFVRSNLVSDQINPNFVLSQGYPAGILDPARVVNPEVNSYPKAFPLPYIFQWNYTVQQQLPGRFVLEAGYTGSAGRKLYYSNNINLPIPGPGNVDARRPIQAGVSNISLYAPLVKSNYNALLLQLERRFSSGFSLLTAYTYGHSIDDSPAPNDTDQRAQDPRNLAANRGSSAFDVRHRVVTSWSYELPFGRGKKLWSSNAVADALAGGWQISGIFTAQTGLPFTPTLNFDPTNTGTTARPNRIGDGNLPRDQRTATHWFDTSAFVAPASYTYGSAGRNFLVGPGLINLDLSLARAFRLSERFGLQFRAEAFNLSNTPHFSIPNATIGNANAGTISSVVSPERQMQFALRLSF